MSSPAAPTWTASFEYDAAELASLHFNVIFTLRDNCMIAVSDAFKHSPERVDRLLASEARRLVNKRLNAVLRDADLTVSANQVAADRVNFWVRDRCGFRMDFLRDAQRATAVAALDAAFSRV